MGRRSYEIMGPHWAASEGPIATAMNDKPKAVFSHTLKSAGWGPVEILGRDPSVEIAELKARDDEGTILVHGGPDLATSLTHLNLSTNTSCRRSRSRSARAAARSPSWIIT